MGWKIGDRVGGGKWHLNQRLGAGTYAEVWRAEDPLLGRTRALKKLHPHLERSTQLWTEARNLSALEHKNIVRLWEWDVDGAFMVIDFVEGKSLDAVLRDCQREGRWPDHRNSAHITELCLEALEAAHEKKVAHGDVKPGNILVPISSAIGADFDRLRLADFGVARNLQEDDRAGEPWQAADWRGSRSYAAPEVLRGQSPTESSDLFSLGIIAYLLLVGKHPFVDPTGLRSIPELVRDSGFVPDYAPITDECLRDVVQKLVDKDAGERYSSATQALDALRECIKISAPPEAEELEPEAPELPEEEARRRRARRAGVEVALETAIERALEFQRMGQQLSALDILQEAVAAHRAQGEQYPALFSRVYSQAAFLVNSQRRYSEAIELCDQAIALHPTSYAYQTKGYALRNLGRLDEAVNMLDRALEHDTDGRRQSQILLHKARVLYLQGDFAAARSVATEAVALNPANEQARRMLARIPVGLAPPE